MGEYTVTGSGLDCKSSAYGSEGSSPSSPTNDFGAPDYDYIRS